MFCVFCVSALAIRLSHVDVVHVQVCVHKAKQVLLGIFYGCPVLFKFGEIARKLRDQAIWQVVTAFVHSFDFRELLSDEAVEVAPLNLLRAFFLVLLQVPQ